MEHAIELARTLVTSRQWSKDRFDRWRTACFRAALKMRVGDELWAKIFLVVGYVAETLVDLVNENFEEP